MYLQQSPRPFCYCGARKRTASYVGLVRQTSTLSRKAPLSPPQSRLDVQWHALLTLLPPAVNNPWFKAGSPSSASRKYHLSIFPGRPHHRNPAGQGCSAIALPSQPQILDFARGEVNPAFVSLSGFPEQNLRSSKGWGSFSPAAL